MKKETLPTKTLSRSSFAEETGKAVDAAISIWKRNKAANTAEIMESLPAELRPFLEKMEIDELVGIAPTWDAAKIGEYIVGTVSRMKHGIGKYASSVMMLDTPNGPFSVWLSADLRLKFEQLDVIGLHVVVIFQGLLDVGKGNPMKQYRVLRVKPDFETLA